MKPWIAALALAAPAAAYAEEGKPSLDDRFFKAYYQENGLRDFEKAAALYAEVAAAAREAKDPATEGKALLGRARCLKATGKKDEAAGAARAVLGLDGGSEEAKALLASLEGRTAAGGVDKDLDERCETLLSWLAGQDVQGARREFALLGARGLPYLEKALRYRSLEHVEGAARLLATGAIPGGVEVLRRAIADADVLYSRVLCEAVLSAEDLHQGRNARVEDLPLLEEVARRPEPDLRVALVFRISSADLGSEPGIVAILRALAADPEPKVRLAVLQTGWLPSYWRTISPAVVAALKSPNPEERAAAVVAVKQDPDLLRTVAADVRALLNDASPEVRAAAFGTLNDMDGLGQADLAGLLGDSSGGLVAAAGERLREIAPWEKGVGDAVRGALRKALLAEIPAGGIESVIAFLEAEPRPGGLTVDDLVSLFLQSWAPEQRLGARAASDVRARILQAINNRVPTESEGIRVVQRGMREIRSPDGLLQWLNYWTLDNSYRSLEIGIAAVASPDPRLRAVGYRCISNCPPASDPRTVTAALTRLSEDLVGEDADLQGAAMAVATVYPDPLSVQAIRKHHAASQGWQRSALLQTLARAVGKDAEPEVRADLESRDANVRSSALAVLFRELGAMDIAEIRRYLKSGGTPREVAGLWVGGNAKRPDLDLLRAFLQEIGTARADDVVLRAAALLPVPERNTFLAGALQHPSESMRAHAAGLVAAWRAMDCVKPLSALLDDPVPSVQAAAAKALEELNRYLERKAAAARLLDGPAVDPLEAAKALLRSGDPAKRRGAILALAALQDKAAIPLLLKALDDEDATVREAAITVLERLGGPR